MEPPTPTQAAAVERCIAKARRAPGHHGEETEGGEAYAYSLKGDRIAWGLNAPQSREATIKDVSRHMRLDWHTVKELENIYMREQLRLAGPPRPEVIGVDEISIRKGHTYRVVVSDLEKRRAIWFGGEGRTQADMDRFYAQLGKENAEKIRLAVMDMWKPFRKSAQQHAPASGHCLRQVPHPAPSIRSTR